MSFQNTTVVATGLSDFHKMAVTICKNLSLKKLFRGTIWNIMYNVFYSLQCIQSSTISLVENENVIPDDS